MNDSGVDHFPLVYQVVGSFLEEGNSPSFGNITKKYLKKAFSILNN